jgi:aldose sugar dehydrogenase
MRTPRRACLSILLAGTAVACAGGQDTGAADAADTTSVAVAAGPPANCQPLDTATANAPDQQPAFEGQTRACGVTSNVAFDVTVLASGLVQPWSVEPLPGGDLLVTEKPGRMRIVSAAGQVGEPISGVPAVDAERQGGLLDVALSPAFATDRTIYWSFSEPRDGGNATSVARGVLSADRTALENVQVIFRSLPAYDGHLHFGSRLAFGPDGMLYVTTGDRSDAPMRQHAQRVDGHLGKVMRIQPDGSAPADNPFVNQQGARPEIWSLGHRNVQASAFDQQGRLWTIEHGTRGGDELNLIEKGNNYGWPLQAYGIEYSGDALPGVPQPDDTNLVQPVYYWDPVIAPSGAQFYTGSAFPEWRGSLFIGALRQQRLVRLTIDGERVTGEEHLLTDRRQRIRDVRQGPDGLLYLVTDAEDGQLLKIAPR